MAETARVNERFNSILLDRTKFSKATYEQLPIKDIDVKYFDSQNTIYLLDFSPILGAIFVSYKNDICIIEKNHVLNFFDKNKERVIKTVNVLPNGSPVISMIRLSPCQQMIAVAAGDQIYIFSVPDLMNSSAKLLTNFQGKGEWDYLEWKPPATGAQPQDTVLGISKEGKLYCLNLQTATPQTSNNQKITTATFSSTGESIVAINDKNELIVYQIANMQISKTERITFMTDENFNITTLTHIQEIKPDLWLIGGVCDDDSNPCMVSRHVYMIEGNLVQKKIGELPSQLFERLFAPLLGYGLEKLTLPYFKFHYVPSRDVIISGISQGNEITMIIGEKGQPGGKLKSYFGLHMSSEIKPKTEPYKLNLTLTRGFALCTSKFSENDTFEYLEGGDDAKSIAYPPFVVILTSAGLLCKYLMIDQRAEFANDNILVDAQGVSALKRTIQLKSFGAPVLKPSAQPQPQAPGQGQGQSKPQTQPQPQPQPQNVAPQQKETYDPQAKKMKELRTRITKLSEEFTSSQSELVDKMKNVVVKILADDEKKCYKELRDVELKFLSCQKFLETTPRFFGAQNFANERLEKLAEGLTKEAVSINKIVKERIVEGSKLLSYTNCELAFETQKVKNQYNRLTEQMECLENFIQNYIELNDKFPTVPHTMSQSGFKHSYEQKNLHQSFSQYENGIDGIQLNLDPISSCLSVSKDRKNPPVNPFNKSTIPKKMSLTQSFKASQMAKSRNISLAQSSTKLNGSSAQDQTELEYNRQLKELSDKFKDVLDQTAEEVHDARSRLRELQKRMNIVPKTEKILETPKQRSSVKSAKKKKKPSGNRISFPDSDSEGDEVEYIEEPSDFFAGLLQTSKTSKLGTTSVEMNPFQKLDNENYRGPKLDNVLEDLQAFAGVKLLARKPTQPASNLQPVQKKTLIPITEQKPPVQKVEEKVKPPSSGATTGQSGGGSGLLSFSLNDGKAAPQKPETGGPLLLNKAPVGKPAQEEAKKEGEVKPPATQAGGAFAGLGANKDPKQAAGLGLNKPATTGLFNAGEAPKEKTGTFSLTGANKPATTGFGNLGPGAKPAEGQKKPDEEKKATEVGSKEAAGQKPTEPVKKPEGGLGLKSKASTFDLASLGISTEDETTSSKKEKFSVGSLIPTNQSSEEDLPTLPILERNESVAPELFKTMTGRPDFLKKQDAKQKEDLSKPKEDLTQSIPLFTKKIEPKKSETQEPPKELPKQLEKIVESPAEVKQNPPGTGINPFQAQPAAPKTNITQPNQPAMGGNLLNKTAPTTENKPNMFLGSGAGLPNLGANNANLFTSATIQNKTGQPGTATAPIQGLSSAQTQGGNRFALSSSNPSTGGTGGAAFGQPGFGASSGPKFGASAGSAFGQHGGGGVAFGQHSTGLGQAKPQGAPTMVQSQKVFGSGSSMFGGGATNANANAGGNQNQGQQSGGGSMLFSSAVSNSGSNSFLGGGAGQQNQAFNFGGASGGLGAARKTKNY